MSLMGEIHSSGLPCAFQDPSWESLDTLKGSKLKYRIPKPQRPKICLVVVTEYWYTQHAGCDSEFCKTLVCARSH